MIDFDAMRAELHRLQAEHDEMRRRIDAARATRCLDTLEGVLLAIAMQPIPTIGLETALMYDGDESVPQWIAPSIGIERPWTCSYCGGVRSGARCPGCGAPRML